jgi:hypothetical protein
MTPRFLFLPVILGAMVSIATSLGATTVFFGNLTESTDYRFDIFGDNHNATTRGANLGGSISATWYGINMSIDATGAGNGISWSGSAADAVAQGSVGQFGYEPIYSGYPGTAASANSLTNTGIFGSPVINISAIPGYTYSIDLLFANAFNETTNGRTFDVFVAGVLYLDNLRLEMGATRPEVYRFSYTAAGSQIQITFGTGTVFGAYTDTNPYVNGVMVTQTAVPEPSTYASIFGALVLAGTIVARRRRKA